MAFDLSKFASTVPSCRPRTIEAVTEEILDIKQRVAEDFMELGQRLCEAKELLPHGEWLPWLEERVQFSERTAQKFMQLAREYESNPKLAADLGSEKAFALLALPKEEREQIAAEGATVNGKTKAPADLTTREVKQIVAERKQSGYAEQRAQEYLAERDRQEEIYKDLLWKMREPFAKTLRLCRDRQEGIDVLKHQFRHSGSESADAGWHGNNKGLQVHGPDFQYIGRTWTEVWDMLAVMALQEAGRKQPEPEGQLTIAWWMPGGTNPGSESGLCACMMPLNPMGEPVAKVLYWDGVLGVWKFSKGGEAVKMEPVGWMRLPEWRK